MPEDAHNIAVFVDLENVVIGAREAGLKKFDFDVVLRRLVEKGNIVAKRAYADWGHFAAQKRSLHEAAVELIDIPASKASGKNSADIKMVVDALELAYTKPHIDVFALITGDSDFSPLVSKLRENNKHIIGVGVKRSTSSLLIDNCDEFILYDDLIRAPAKRMSGSKLTKAPKLKQEAFQLLLDAVGALEREHRGAKWSSLVKDTMRRKQPQFNEEYHGYKSFSRLLEDAEKHGLIRLSKDARSGTYVVEEAGE
jgi:uncharacterized protein (TIGR00288 family)